MIKEGFVREVYLRSTPSVDLELLAEGQKVDCTKHSIPMSVYDEIVEEYCPDNEARTAAGMFMLMSGPQLVEG